MSKRFTLAIGALAGMAALLVACSPGSNTEGEPREEQPGLEGEAQVSVKGLSAYEIQSMVVTAFPANITRTLTYSADAGAFIGTLVLPTGTQTLTANGYAYVGQGDGGMPDAGPGQDAGPGPDAGPSQDAGSTTGLTLVATGTATVNIVANTTTAVSMRIYDQSPPQPQPDIGPYIRAVTASSVDTQTNQAISLSVVAEDLDGDPLSYQWTSDCPASGFANSTVATTTWAASEPGPCRLTVAVSSRGMTATESVQVIVFAGGPDGGSTGGAQVNGEYIPRPQVRSLELFATSGDLPPSMVYREWPFANLPPVRPNQTYMVQFYTDFGTRLGTRSTTLTVSCGILSRSHDLCENSFGCYTYYTWSTPDAGGTACKLTASATNEMLSDSFSAGVLVR